ncbi:hypothetical protein NUW58_g8564 [Xylaria curta]|uniref:Uncharacterized protein n=1 Tax=Xylaria curta TaxID=42375 RepID=A0ACC1N7Y2_9PEZI|nr:hypothetical protein NUW58_g8564 [Xylaria curta]
MDEILELRRLISEEQRRRKELEKLTKEAEKLAEEERELTKEAKRQTEEAKRRTEEARRQTKEAEKLIEESQLQALPQYLEACHSLHLAIRDVSPGFTTTQSNLTNPTGQILPRRIVLWHDFADRQDAVWDQLAVGKSFSSKLNFPSLSQLEYVRSTLDPISSQFGLQSFERNTVERPVRKLFDTAYDDPQLRLDLNLGGDIGFESDTHPDDISDIVSSSTRSMFLEGEGDAKIPNLPERRRRKARGKGNRSGLSHICHASDGKNVPVAAIEYIPPYKLAQDDLVAGLRSEIQPERDVIHKDGDSYEFACMKLATAVVTRLFSYMVGKGLQYGYICTGEVFIFLFIPEDPSTVYYSVSIPQLDVMADGETRLHYTAVSQVFAFVLHAVLATKPPQSWHDAANELKTWDVELDHRLPQSPTAPPVTQAEQRAKKRAEKEADGPNYEPECSKASLRSPIRTHSSCKSIQLSSRLQENGDDNGDSGNPPSPSLHQPSRPADATSTSRPMLAARESTRTQRRRSEARNQSRKPRIQDRLYCTQRCLIGLAEGGATDTTCPNSQDHKSKHISSSEFIRLARDQLATDRGCDADCTPLYLAGAIGALFKFRLSSHGYTLVAKGTELMDLDRLNHERDVYSWLQPVQGEHVPVCLGMTDLELPYYYDCGVYTHFLFLSWSGRSLYKCLAQLNKPDTLSAVEAAYSSLHRQGALHLDAEARNILYDDRTQKIMIIDFERTKFSDSQLLGSIGLDRPMQKEEWVAKNKDPRDLFTQELQCVTMTVSKCFDNMVK